MGLDYHYDNSPREIQREVFARQLRHAVRLGKPLTIHTREADEDTERLLKELVPKDHRVCAVLSPLLAWTQHNYRYIYIVLPIPQNSRKGFLTISPASTSV